MKTYRLRYFLITVLLLTPNLSSSTELSKYNRESLLKVIFSVCPRSIPLPARKHFSEAQITLYCSCYADEVADNFTKEEFREVVSNAKAANKPFSIPENIGLNASNSCIHYFQ